MPDVPIDYLETITAAINQVTGASKSAALAILTQLTQENEYATPMDMVEDALKALEPLFEQLTMSTASLSAQAYDIVRLAEMGDVFGALPYQDRDPEWTRKALYGIAKHSATPEAFIQAILDRLDYEAKRAAGSTSFQNGYADARGKPMFARVPTGRETCPFCIMLASRGFVYRSSKTAGQLDHYHAHCVTGDEHVSGRGLVAALRRHYEGPLVRIITAMGNNLTVTPEHPILTTRGWVLAGDLVKGDGLISATLNHGHEVGVPNVNDANPTAKQVFEAARFFSSPVAHAVPATTENLNGEAVTDGDVEVVYINRPLRDTREAPVPEPCDHAALAEAFTVSGGPRLVDGSPGNTLLMSDLSTTDGSMGGDGLRCPLFAGHFGGSDDTRLRLAPQGTSGISKPTDNGGAADAVLVGKAQDAITVLVAFDNVFGGRDALPSSIDAVSFQDSVELGFANTSRVNNLLRGHPGDVQVDNVTVISRTFKRCHVYNFRTVGHWFSCENIITHNCDCRVVPSFGGGGIRGYDPDEYYEQYQQMVEDGTLNVAALERAASRAHKRARS